MRLLLLNGPNLNLLGQREPGLYGSATLAQIEADLQEQARGLGVSLDCFQSNFEGALVDRVHQAMGQVDGILINAGATPTPPLPCAMPFWVWRFLTWNCI